MLDKSIIDQKREDLNRVAAQLKTEFFGLDDIIDRVMDRLTAWYIFPQLITRPVIINLWGMTGVGKTQLVRRIAALLNFGDRFVEVVMDGGSTHGYWSSSLSSILRESKIEEGAPGILLLDEIQRFRTVDNVGNDVKVERFQDIWTLLSDGKFSSDSSIFNEIEMMLAQRLYKPETPKKVGGAPDAEETREETSEKLSPWQARHIKKTLRLSQSVREIMTWTADDLLQIVQQQQQRESWEYDYTKLIIFISGNLDSAFTGSTSTDDCDTDADFYHELTKSVSIAKVKRSLRERFKPEQIARLGNNHIIYPSMNRASYCKLIESTCLKYLNEMTAISGVGFEIDRSVLEEIYDNSVFPTQGTRPVFSSIHLIFSSLLVSATFWAIENEIDHVTFIMHDSKHVQAIGNGLRTILPVELNVNERKEKTSRDFKTLVAVHEAGHAVLYALLTKTCPFEVKINIASFDGGYMLEQPEGDKDGVTKETIRNRICILFGGRAAEEVVFGSNHIVTGGESDIGTATMLASSYVRQYSFGDTLGRVNGTATATIQWLTNLDETNPEISQLLLEEYVRAGTMLTDHRQYLKAVVEQLLIHEQLSQDDFIQLSKPFAQLTKQRNVNFGERWEIFKRELNDL
jgi:cell division protease FtsH